MRSEILRVKQYLLAHWVVRWFFKRNS